MGFIPPAPGRSMHREISHVDEALRPQSNLGLYLFTGLMALFLGADQLAGPWASFVTWLGDATGGSLSLPAWPDTVLGIRLAMVAAVLGGARALYSAVNSLLEGRIGADLALALAAVAAILLLPGQPEVAAEVVFIGLIGECLEAFTFDRTRRAVRKIVEVCPRRCWRLRDGVEERILVTELQAGDMVVVKPGGRVPADGVVLDGRSSVDTSALTGESLPAERGPGRSTRPGRSPSGRTVSPSKPSSAASLN
jgi:cation transport ATPase